VAEGRDLIAVPSADELTKDAQARLTVVGADAPPERPIKRWRVFVRKYRRPGEIAALIALGAGSLATILLLSPDQVWTARGLLVLSVLALLRLAWVLWRRSPNTARAVVTGSLGRRMIIIAAIWICLLLAGGGYALDRVLTGAVTRNFDDQLNYVLTSLFTSIIATVGTMYFIEKYDILHKDAPADSVVGEQSFVGGASPVPC